MLCNIALETTHKYSYSATQCVTLINRKHILRQQGGNCIVYGIVEENVYICKNVSNVPQLLYPCVYCTCDVSMMCPLFQGL